VRPTPDTEPRPKVEPQPDGTDAQVVGVRTAADREAAARAAAVVIDDAVGDDGSADRERNRERFRAAQRRGPNWFDLRTTSMKRPGLPPTEAKREVQRGTPPPASQRANDSDDESTVYYDAPTSLATSSENQTTARTVDLTKTRPANSPQSVPTFPSRIEVVLRQEAPKPGILGDGTRTSPFDLTSDPLTFARLNQLQANTAKKSIRSEDSVRKDNVRNDNDSKYSYKSNAREQRKGSLAKFRWHRSVAKQKRKDAKTPKRRAKSRKTQAKELREGPTRAEQVQPVPMGARRRGRVIQYSY
jgi:hypothetical protein